jgi:hypothetical protein
MVRRWLFFAALAAVNLIMLEPTPDQYHWVNYFGAGLATFWAIMLFLEERSLAKALSAPKKMAAAEAPAPDADKA